MFLWPGYLKNTRKDKQGIMFRERDLFQKIMFKDTSIRETSMEEI